MQSTEIGIFMEIMGRIPASSNQVMNDRVVGQKCVSRFHVQNKSGKITCE